MTQTTDSNTRWISWLTASKARATAMEQFTPASLRSATRQQRNRLPEVGAVENWYEPNPIKYPVQDGDMLVKGKWFKRQPVVGLLGKEAA